MTTEKPQTVNAIKAALKVYAEKNRLSAHRLSVTKYDPGVVTVHGWPSMQGCGAVSAGYVAERWYKFSEYAKTLGVRLCKAGRRWDS